MLHSISSELTQQHNSPCPHLLSYFAFYKPLVTFLLHVLQTEPVNLPLKPCLFGINHFIGTEGLNGLVLQHARQQKGYLDSLIRMGDEFRNEAYTHR